MDHIAWLRSHVRLLERSARSLRNNVDFSATSGAMIFRNNRSAKNQIRRIVELGQLLSRIASGPALHKRATALFDFAVDDWALMGSKHPDDWAEYRVLVYDTAEYIVRWCARTRLAPL